MKSLALVVVGLFAGVAHAEAQYALAVNSPLGWLVNEGMDAPTVGVSAYAAVSDHVVMRGNVAYGPNDTRLDVGECPVGGTHTDGSITAQLYPWQRFDGLFVEGGGLLRSNPNRDFECEEGGQPRVHTDSQELGGLGLVGYTYTGGHFFFSTGVGASYLFESGEETTYPLSSTDDKMPVTAHVHRWTVSGEWMMRFGASW